MRVIMLCSAKLFVVGSSALAVSNCLSLLSPIRTNGRCPGCYSNFTCDLQLLPLCVLQCSQECVQAAYQAVS